MHAVADQIKLSCKPVAAQQRATSPALLAQILLAELRVTRRYVDAACMDSFTVCRTGLFSCPISCGVVLLSADFQVLSPHSSNPPTAPYTVRTLSSCTDPMACLPFCALASPS